MIPQGVHIKPIRRQGDSMKKGKCPKCGSQNIFAARNLPLKTGPFGSNSIPISLTSLAALDNYVCTDCGLVERYVADEDKLKEIAKKWKPVETEKETDNL
jgi:predicted nucleic-acid-binding Zn-ribbon protein